MEMSLGDMRKAMLNGELTSDKVFRAILGATKETNDEFEKMPKTIGMASQALTNDLLVAFSKMDDALGFTSAIAESMGFLSKEIRRVSGDLSEQELLIEKISKQEEILSRVRASSARQGLFVSDEMHAKAKQRAIDLANEIKLMKDRLVSIQNEKSILTIDITKGRESPGPEQATSGELESLAEKLELRFALTRDANFKIEAEELRHRARILEITEEGSDERIKLGTDLDRWRVEEHKRVGQEEVDATNKIEADKWQVRLQGLNALSGLINQTSGLIAAGMEEGNAAAKAAFIVMKGIQVAQIIASTEVAANSAGAQAAAAGGGFFGWLGTSSGIRAVGYASAGLVAGLSIGGGRRHGGLSSPNMATPINEAGVPEILEQSGKQFLLPTGRAGKVTPLNASGSGGQPSVNIFNNGPPIEVENMTVSRDEVNMMIKSQVKAGQKEINASLASGRGDTFQALQKGSRVERRL